MRRAVAGARGPTDESHARASGAGDGSWASLTYGRAKQDRPGARGGFHGVLGPLDVLLHGGGGQECVKPAVDVAVQGEQVSSRVDAPQELRMRFRLLTDDEEGGPLPSSFEEVEDAWCRARVRSVVEGEGYEA